MADLESVQVALEQAHRNAPREPRAYRDYLQDALFAVRHARNIEMGIEDEGLTVNGTDIEMADGELKLSNDARKRLTEEADNDG